MILHFLNMERKEVERSASTQGASTSSPRLRFYSKRRVEKTEQFKGFYVKSLKVRLLDKERDNKEADNKERDNRGEREEWKRTSFEELFSLMNQTCPFFPGEYTKKQGGLSIGFQQMTTAEAVSQLTTKLSVSQSRCTQLRKALDSKEQMLQDSNSQIHHLKITNLSLKSKIGDLREEVMAIKHQRHAGQYSRTLHPPLKQNLHSHTNNPKEEKKKATINKPINGVIEPFSQIHIPQIDSPVLAENATDRPSYGHESKQDKFQCIIIAANNQLRDDLRFLEDYCSRLEIKVDCLEKKLHRQRETLKEQKEKEFSMLKCKLDCFLGEHRKLKVAFNEMRRENARLRKTLPTEDLFRLSLTPKNELE